ILGVVGVTDRGPTTPTPVGNFGEFIELFGPASRYTLPELRTAFANGVSRAVVARVAPGSAQKAFRTLLDDDGEQVVTLEARAEGAWGNTISVKVTQIKALSGKGIKYVNLEIFIAGKSVEVLNNLVLNEDSPDYFFDRINSDSRVLIAIDPLFQKTLPASIAATALADADGRAAFATLKAGAADVIRVDGKKQGKTGNLSSIAVSDGQAGMVLLGAADAPSIEVSARQAGSDGTGIRVSVAVAGPDSINLVITPAIGAPRTLGPFTTVNALVAAAANDPDVIITARGAVLPSVIAATPLPRRINIDVITEGRDTSTYSNLSALADIAAITDPLVTFSVVEAATQLPDVNTGINLLGGRNKGAALLLTDGVATNPLLEIVPASGINANLSVAITQAISTLDGKTGVVNVVVLQDGATVETFTNLTMDPDDENYLPEVLANSSQLIRAHDLFVRSRATSLPMHNPRPLALSGGTSPLADDYQTALENLEAAEEVDLVIAAVANQLDDSNIRAVHQLVVAHCTKMADVARNRIGLGSVTNSESAKVDAILDHGDDVRSDHFILSAPAGSEAALAGLLGLQDYFQSPTFKTIAALGVPAGAYTDSQLEKLITGNIAAINEKRGLGIIVIKGLLTSGRQINVQRTANKSVREVKAISDKYIGLLNNEGARNALRQQIIALFLQMEKDGALVPSTDGKDPAFFVNVYSTQTDFANGIVRIDIAIRPVRAIDYIYATILVKN
ncbi:MAG TPA: hypothetical protein VGK97_07580, partial [Spongiibacteraceae bacterium]